MTHRKLLCSVVWLLLLLSPLLCSAGEQDVVRFGIRNADIQKLEEQGGVIWIRLTPSASDRLRTQTEESYGREMSIEMDGLVIVQAHVHAVIDSGVIQVVNPSPEAKRRLETLAKLRSNRS